MARRIKVWAARDKHVVGGKPKTKISLQEPTPSRLLDGSEIFTLPVKAAAGGSGALPLTDKLAVKLRLRPGEKTRATLRIEED